jgi:hypothetical protein
MPKAARGQPRAVFLLLYSFGWCVAKARTTELHGVVHKAMYNNAFLLLYTVDKSSESYVQQRMPNVAQEPVLHHSALATATYHDLLQALRDESIGEMRGTPRKETRNSRTYWYDVYRVGNHVKKRYIGEDNADTAQRITDYEQLAKNRTARSQDRVRLIRVLAAEGFQRIDATSGSLINTLAEQGAFRLGATIVGTHAFRLYEGELAIKFRTTDFLNTGDIDLAQFCRIRSRP